VISFWMLLVNMLNQWYVNLSNDKQDNKWAVSINFAMECKRLLF